MKDYLKRFFVALMTTLLISTNITTCIFAEDGYTAPGTRQKLYVSDVDVNNPDGIYDGQYKFYFVEEEDPLNPGTKERFVVYCFNSNLLWPVVDIGDRKGLDASGEYTNDYYVPDDFFTLSDEVKDKIYKIFYAGYPHNNAGLYLLDAEAFNPSLSDIVDAANLIKTDNYFINYINNNASKIVDTINTMWSEYGYNPQITSIDLANYNFDANNLLYSEKTISAGNVKYIPSTIEAAFVASLGSFLDDWNQNYDKNLFLNVFNKYPLQYALLFGFYNQEVTTLESLQYMFKYFGAGLLSTTEGQAHDATQQAIWQILHDNNIKNNSKDFSEYMFDGSLAKKLVDFANNQNVNIPGRQYTITQMAEYKNKFETGNYLLRNDNSAVGVNGVIDFRENVYGEYVSEPLHFENMFQMAYEVQLYDGEDLIASCINYGTEPFTLSAGYKPNNPVLKIVSESEWPADVYQYVNENEKNMSIDDRNHENSHQDMGGTFYRPLKMMLPLGTTFTDADRIKVEVHKIWNDDNNRDGLRSNYIVVELLKNGVATGEKITLNQNNGWRGYFENLPTNDEDGSIVYTVKEETTLQNYTSSINKNENGIFVITNTHNIETINISGEKHWLNDTEAERPDSIVVNLYANGNKVSEKTITKENDWKYTFNNLPKNENGNIITYTISENSISNYTSEVKGYDLYNTYDPEKTNINVSKIWNDDDNNDGIRPNEIVVTLYANGEVTDKTVTLNSANSWNGTFSNLNLKDSNGTLIQYTVNEQEVTGYTSVITGNATDGFVITNTHNNEKVSIKGSKTWVLNGTTLPTDQTITIHLHADGTKVQEKTISASDNWKYEFNNLPKYANGNLINYSIHEVAIENYESSIVGYDITNTYKPVTTSVQVTKEWIDNNNEDGFRPNEIVVTLYRNNVKTNKTLILNEGNSWSGSFTNLEKKDTDNNDYEYSVKEQNVLGYISEVSGNATNGFVITNTHNIEYIDISGTKYWDDANNQDGKRPPSIVVNLYKNGIKIDSKIISQSDDWKYKFENLKKYENGTEIAYTIGEEQIDGYRTSIEGFNIKNSYTPGKVSIFVEKAWSDSNNQDGKRPSSVTVQLYADGVATEVYKQINAIDNWQAVFNDLDEYKNGQKINYTVKEVNIQNGYSSTITGTMEKGYVVTNTRNTEKTKVSVEKVWVDNNNPSRPESVVVRLYGDGELKDSVVLNSDNLFKHEFNNLPKYKNGSKIHYTVSETVPTSYSSNVELLNSSDENHFKYKITNTHNSTSVQVTKEWLDSNNQDGKRPSSIKVWLYADGVKTPNYIELNENNNWTGSFTGLNLTNGSGQNVVYTVDEEIAGTNVYNKVITGSASYGYKISNSYNPEYIDISGSKTWDDNNNQDGKRPESINVHLLANGAIIETKVVSTTDNWEYSFTHLPKYYNQGTEVVYTITEDSVFDYSVEYTGFDIKNTHTPGKRSVTVVKNWDDKNDDDGIRPDYVVVELYKNGQATGSKLTLSKDNNFEGAFSNLDVYENRLLIEYTVKEERVPGYDYYVSGNADNGYVITNTHHVTPPKETPNTSDNTKTEMWGGLAATSLIWALVAFSASKLFN